MRNRHQHVVRSVAEEVAHPDFDIAMAETNGMRNRRVGIVLDLQKGHGCRGIPVMKYLPENSSLSVHADFLFVILWRL